MKNLLHGFHEIGFFLKSVMAYLRTGRPFDPDAPARSLIYFHCKTSGYFNDALHWMVKRCRRPYALPHSNGILGNLAKSDLERMAGEIKRKGHYVFPKLLPAKICDKLTEFALTRESMLISSSESVPKFAVYKPSQPIAGGYRFTEQALIDNPEIQNLISDLSILSVAQAYLGCSPVLGLMTMWWSVASELPENEREEMAQRYHFDMDGIKWIKFFFYLTDVTSTRGPHRYVAKSHRRGAQPLPLLKYGYARIPDSEIKRYYPKDAFIEITGPRGTMFAADTRGFHKGEPPMMDDRLVLVLEFCDSLYGTNYPKPHLRTDSNDNLRSLTERYRRVYSKFAIINQSDGNLL